MPTDDKQLLESLQGRSPNLSPNRLAKTLYDQEKDDAHVRARQDVAYRLIDEFNKFCKEHGNIEYFAIANTLVGAVVYKDFIPGSYALEVGMLRSEYLKLEKAYYEAGGVNGLLFGASLSMPDSNGDRENFEADSWSALQNALDTDDSANLDDLARIIDDSLHEIPQPGDTSHVYTANDDKIAEINRDAATAIKSRYVLGPLQFLIRTAAALTERKIADYSTYLDTVEEESDTYRYIHPRAYRLPVVLTTHQDLTQRYHTNSPSLQLPGYCLAKKDGELLYSNDHMPIRINMTIAISIFDEVPDDYDFSRFLYRRIKNVNLIAENVNQLLPEALRTRSEHRLRNYQWKLADKYNGTGQLEVSRLVPSRSRTMPVADIRPIRMIDFGPVQVMAPQNVRAWIEEDPERQAKQVAQLQSDALEIIKEIDRICRANDIGYFVCGGTMLGYVRHGGFIPWDDDMDVGMLRDDYDRFVEIAAEQIDANRFFLQTRETDPKIPYLFSKVRLKNSEYITKYNEFRDFDRGICVDLFPFDKVPYELGGLKQFKASLRPLIREHNKRANRQVGDMPSTEPRTIDERIAREIMTVRHEYYRSKSLAETQDAYTEAVTAYNGIEGLNYVASFNPTFTMVHLDDLLPYQDVEFEGVTLKVPAHPEVFLQMQYGNYMTLPLPHQQQGHGLLWWSDPDHDAGEYGFERYERAKPAHHVSVTSRVAKIAIPFVIASAIVGTAMTASWSKKHR